LTDCADKVVFFSSEKDNYVKGLFLEDVFVFFFKNNKRPIYHPDSDPYLNTDPNLVTQMKTESASLALLISCRFLALSGS
jgi:hypothetical protein